jgi:hypothetical protein
MKKKYVVEPTKAQRQRPKKPISAGTAPARMLNRARILLSRPMQEASTPKAPRLSIKRSQRCSRLLRPRCREGTRERFCAQGLEAALERSVPDRAYKRSLDGRAEARPIALARSEPPEGRDRWSLRLLADEAVELGIVGELSHETVRKTLKKTSFGPTSSSSG